MRRKTLPAIGFVLGTGVMACLAGCGGSPPAAQRTPPDLAAFLRLPVATPTSCPPSSNGETVGRRSPWVGHVDVSVFVADSATGAEVAALRSALQALAHVQTVYFESRADAYAEFQRLYTCSAQLKPADVPASYRVVLGILTRPERDALVRSIYGLTGVSSVSCDPSSPCVDVRP